MIDPDLKKQLDSINIKLEAIKNKTGISFWRAFLNGTLSGLGSIVGVAIALAIIGYILNVVGVIPGLKGQVNSWHQTLDNLGKMR